MRDEEKRDTPLDTDLTMIGYIYHNISPTDSRDTFFVRQRVQSEYDF